MCGTHTHTGHADVTVPTPDAVVRCALGECGDPSCPTYRPKRPEVRMAVEKCILETLATSFRPVRWGAWGTPKYPRSSKEN